ncbi:putative Lysine exporter protein (LYSE/YGGA) [Mesorhizobium metallidurans STM 2683]|uniref:Putative Lysine exporter protein (LYSE/YGGA) n=1 Tax=Mesorhizobium metallidurans STM 2683 TaxID=1297569 RepID=M5ET31_9HYPH|nr:LysE family translocator [Mesorhizobium metallidurans]CCV07148.1 putative Lysine exporter protein (LYSE/YGGA) [Mesorhizobium metallidurans STM 2683]
MDWNSLAQFSAATLLILITPGPIMAIIAHSTLRHGAKAGLSTAIGVELGEVCLLGAIFAGLSLSGELLPVLLRWLSLAGALYLIWLAAGLLHLRNRPSRCPNLSGARAPVLDGLMIAFASPAALLFYAAFFPQFIDPDHSISEQMVLLSATYVCMRSVSASACVFTVARLRLPVGCAQVGRFANLGSAAVYLMIAVITVLRLLETLG